MTTEGFFTIAVATPPILIGGVPIQSLVIYLQSDDELEVGDDITVVLSGRVLDISPTKDEDDED